jgi:SynChlorMet cassette radical SAM/SPASM protein ScmF
MGCEPELSKKNALTKARKPDLPEGVPPLLSLYVYISGSCNLACRHCWIEPDYQAGDGNGKFIRFEHLKKAVREAKPLGLQSIKLTGGEPMLHPQFRQIVEHIESQRIGMLLETNGTLIDDDTARFLKAKKFFNFVSVSLDGAREATHDRLRGVRKSHRSAIAGIRSLVKAGFQPQMICTLHKGNVGEIDRVIDMAAKLGCGSIKFNHVQKLGRGNGFFSKNGLTVGEIITLHRSVLTLEKKYPSLNIHFDVPMAFLPIKKLLNDRLGRCAVKSILGILSGGEMALCGIGVTVPELVFGDIASDRIQDIWTRSPFLAELRKSVPAHFSGTCGACMFRDYCLGSCIANNYHQSRQITAPYFFCEEARKLGLFPAGKLKPGDVDMNP